MAGPLRPNPPLLSSLMAVGTLENKGSNKNSFFLNGPACPPPFLMARPLREESFFADSLKAPYI